MTEAETGVAGPVLLHTGFYAVYRTPAGGIHVSYRREHALDETTGELRPVEGAPDEHLPEIPPALMAMLDRMLQTGERPSVPQMVRMMMGANGGAG